MITHANKWRVHTASLAKEADDGAAATATAEIPFHTARHRQRVLRIHYHPSAALTANDTNYATLLVYKRDSDGTDQVTLASILTTTTGTGNWVDNVAENFGTITGGTLVQGQQLLFEITKAAAGVVVPRGTLEVEYEVLA